VEVIAAGRALAAQALDTLEMNVDEPAAQAIEGLTGCEQLVVLLVSVGWADLSDLSRSMWGWPAASCVSGVE
jgi:hypothetical protein